MTFFSKKEENAKPQKFYIYGKIDKSIKKENNSS